MKVWILAFAFAALGLGIYVSVKVTTAHSSSAPRTASRAAMVPVEASRPAQSAWRERARHGLAESEVEHDGPAEVRASEDPAASGSAPTSEEMRNHIQASFAADPAGSPGQAPVPDLEARLRAVIPAGSVVRSLECRSSLCRIETTHPGFEEFRDFVQRAYLTPEPTRVSNGPVFAMLLAAPVKGQPVVAVAYLGRVGSILPMPMPMPDAPTSEP